MTRNIIAVIAAIVTGGVVVYFMDVVGHWIYPVPSGLDPSRPETIVDYFKSAPVGALLFVALSQAAGAFSGGFIGTIISKTQRIGLIYGMIALVFGVVNLLTVPHPVWLAVLLILLPIPSALLGGSTALFVRREPAGEGSAPDISTY